MSGIEPEAPRPVFQPSPQPTDLAPVPARSSPPQTQQDSGAPLKTAAVLIFCVGLASVGMLRARHAPASIAPGPPKTAAVQPAPAPAPAVRAIPPAQPVSAEASPLPFYREGGAASEETVGLAGARDDGGLMPLEALQQAAAKAQASTPAPAPNAVAPQACPNCDGRAMTSQMGLYQPGRAHTRAPFLRYLGECGGQFLFQVTNLSNKTLMRVVSSRGESWSVYLRPRETTTIKSKVKTDNFTLNFGGISGLGMRRQAGAGN
ncbi:MAG: hypothetical protein NTY77_11335 [Elusimicrobia bacterium]|nr:hypothetical protein [Elusimicrobiota bacterium]